MTDAKDASNGHPCPDSSELRDYLLGQLPDGEFETVDSHVNSCLTCADALKLSPRMTDGLTFQLSQLPADSDFGEYELIHRLGQGGMGHVYRARHRMIGQDFALKVVKPELRDDPQFAERFRREVEGLGQVNSSHVVRPVHAGQWKDSAFVVMELIDGNDVETVIRQTDTFNSADSAEFAAQLVSGLAAIHSAGMVHRDLHPGNVLLNRSGEVKIIDFGLIRADRAEVEKQGLTDARDRLGADSFISPEQHATPDAVTAAADYFSLGCVWYFLLTGRILPRDPVTHCIARIEQCLSAIPRRCRPLIRRLLADTPETRLQSSTELLTSLSTMRRKARLADRLDSTAAARRSASRRRRMTGCASAVLLATLGIAGAYLEDQPPTPSPYHRFAQPVISVPYLQGGPFSRPYFFEAYPQKYTLELVDQHEGMLSNGRLITFWYYDCVGNPKEMLLATMDQSPRPSMVVKLMPGTHKVGIWSARNDVWEGEQRKVVDRATVIFYVYPDLEIGPLKLSQGNVQQGGSVVLTVEIRNRGTVKSNDGTLRTFLNPQQPSYLSGAVSDVAIPALKPGESRRVQVLVRVPEHFPTGTASVSVHADADDTTIERDELEVATWPEGKTKDFHFVTQKDPKGVPPENNRKAISMAVISRR